MKELELIILMDKVELEFKSLLSLSCDQKEEKNLFGTVLHEYKLLNISAVSRISFSSLTEEIRLIAVKSVLRMFPYGL